MGNIEKSKEELQPLKNIILRSYKNLIIDYENSRQLYEKVIKEYENNSTSPIVSECSRLVCYNTSYDSVIWRLITPDGAIAYESTPHSRNETFTIELSTILIPDTEFTIHASTLPTEFNCIYISDSNTTAYYNAGATLQVIGVVPLFYVPDTVQYLNCSSIWLYNDSDTIIKYAFYTLDGVQFYETNFISKSVQLTIDLVDLSIQSYTVFKVKAVTAEGTEKIADVTLEYVINSVFESNFMLSGTVDKNELMYTGVGINSSYNPDIKKCSAIVGYSLIGDVTKWQLLSLDNTVLYTSDKYLQYETCKLDLSTLQIPSGTQFKLKSINSTRGDTISDVILEYHLNSSTVYFQSDSSNLDPKLYFNGLVPTSTTPPILKCSSIAANHTEYPVIMRWSLIDEKGSEIYKSGRCSKGSTCSIELSKLNISKGTRLKLKAVVTACADSIAYILLEYDPVSTIDAYFSFYGNSFKTIVPFKGSSDM